MLILRDVLEFSAQETADALETSVASVNSALQRARATLGDRAPAPRAEWSGDAELSEQERELLRGFIETHERGDHAAAVKLMAEDIRVTMPPAPMVYDGIASLRPLFVRAFESEEAGEWRLVPTRLNRMPAAASYHRAPGARSSRRSRSTSCACATGRSPRSRRSARRSSPSSGCRRCSERPAP